MRYRRKVRNWARLTPGKLELAGNHVVLNWNKFVLGGRGLEKNDNLKTPLIV